MAKTRVNVRTQYGNSNKRILNTALINYEEKIVVVSFHEEMEDSEGNVVSNSKLRTFKLIKARARSFVDKTAAQQVAYINDLLKFEDIQAEL